MMVCKPEGSFVRIKRKNAPIRLFGTRLNRAADLYELSGLMFWFMQKKFVGSNLAFKATRRS
jgi:hypothetical protein